MRFSVKWKIGRISRLFLLIRKNLWKALHNCYKWFKQYLRIKEFYGTSENAVKIQIYSAIIAYCLVAIVEHDLKLEMETYDVLRILNIPLLDKTPLLNYSAGIRKKQTIKMILN